MSGAGGAAEGLLSELMLEINIPEGKAQCRALLQRRHDAHGDVEVPARGSPVDDCRLAVRQLWARHPPAQGWEHLEAAAEDEDAEEEAEMGEEEEEAALRLLEEREGAAVPSGDAKEVMDVLGDMLQQVALIESTADAGEREAQYDALAAMLAGATSANPKG